MKTAISRHTQTDTKALILQEATGLLLTRSYVGLSFQDLADRVGIRKASLYHHFASKEALGIALIEAAQGKFVHWAQRQDTLSVPGKIAAYIAMFRDAIGAGQRVCPIGATGGEWDCVEPLLQQAVRQFHQVQLTWLSAVVQQWEGGMPELAQQRAMQINAMLQGALISARIYGDVQVFDTALAPLQASLALVH